MSLYVYSLLISPRPNLVEGRQRVINPKHELKSLVAKPGLDWIGRVDFGTGGH